MTDPGGYDPATHWDTPDMASDFQDAVDGRDVAAERAAEEQGRIEGERRAAEMQAAQRATLIPEPALTIGGEVEQAVHTDIENAREAQIRDADNGTEEEPEDPVADGIRQRFNNAASRKNGRGM